MAGGLLQQSLNGGLSYAYLRSHPVLSFHRRLRPLLHPARSGSVRRQPRLSPYNIERTGENAYRISVAVSGFSQGELSIVAKENTLTIKGEKTANENGRRQVRSAVPRHRGARLRARLPACRFRAGEERFSSRTACSMSISSARSPRPRSPAAFRSSSGAQTAPPQVVDGSRPLRKGHQLFSKHWLNAKRPGKPGRFLFLRHSQMRNCASMRLLAQALDALLHIIARGYASPRN